ncbi:MAG: 50S ribosomal protein L28 [Anaerolineae bacterium]|nr:50S ribosomal protein L28 [Anaerolineae bacterium]
MAACEICGKKPQFGHNVSFSQKKTNRKFLPNIQKTRVMRNGRLVPVQLCSRCLRTMSKDAKI